jgi:demethylmenaquinone methyltransferase/2-methoxy-6-polyprenyl-1,4-benzoquinol methylase
MFTRIARRYDLMNTVMTAGRHHAWRRITAQEVARAPAGPVLDLATGTADLALAIRAIDPARRVIGADFSEGMLGQARRKLGATEREISLLAADALRLPFRDQRFACVTSAFLLRNLEDLLFGLQEMRRVTVPGGRVVSLDITSPALPGWSRLFNLYFNRMVPAIGAVIARDRQAYTYLPESVSRFPPPEALRRLMIRAGFRQTRYRRLALGTIALHVGIV